MRDGAGGRWVGGTEGAGLDIEGLQRDKQELPASLNPARDRKLCGSHRSVCISLVTKEVTHSVSPFLAVWISCR